MEEARGTTPTSTDTHSAAEWASALDGVGAAHDEDRVKKDRLDDIATERSETRDQPAVRAEDNADPRGAGSLAPLTSTRLPTDDALTTLEGDTAADRKFMAERAAEAEEVKVMSEDDAAWLRQRPDRRYKPRSEAAKRHVQRWVTVETALDEPGCEDVRDCVEALVLAEQY